MGHFPERPLGTSQRTLKGPLRDPLGRLGAKRYVLKAIHDVDKDVSKKINDVWAPNVQSASVAEIARQKKLCDADFVVLTVKWGKAIMLPFNGHGEQWYFE